MSVNNRSKTHGKITFEVGDRVEYYTKNSNPWLPNGYLTIKSVHPSISIKGFQTVIVMNDKGKCSDLRIFSWAFDPVDIKNPVIDKDYEELFV